MQACVAAAYTVVAVGIYQLMKWFICLHQSLGQFCGITVMHIVIRSTMTDEQTPTQFFGTGDRTVIIAGSILLRRAHKPLRIDTVIEAIACHRCHSHTGIEYRTPFHH